MSVAASQYEPIVLLGASRRQQLTQSLSQGLQAWRQQWSGGSHVAVHIEPAESFTRKAHLPGGRLQAFVAETAGEPLLVMAASIDMQHELLGLTASRTAVDGGGEVAHAVVAEAFEALCQRLASIKSAEGISVRSCQGDALAQLWSRNGWTVTFKTAGDRVLMWARLSPRLLLAMLPVQAAKPAEPLASRRSAIGEEIVGVQAWLGEAEVALADLTTLRVGDVILLDASIEGAGHLALSDGRPLAGIRLGSVVGRRAVSVIGKTTATAGR